MHKSLKSVIRVLTALCFPNFATEPDIQIAQSRINNRPKKCLGFKQPAVIFKQMRWLLGIKECRSSWLNLS
ncbi:hypothetical protein CTN07_21165 [Photobacterium damselae]|nr:hypothetical protein CTN07_21165 [Photobacterium damselae]